MLNGIMMAVLFMGGLMLGGSESIWFPWPNLIGALMLIWFGERGKRLAR
ncbi:MAG TPA: hypothetical protein PKM59_04850 [Thermodesulfobacteriota bacterium]|nr:hypothetical protein [Thermodesulfobacteriota bacterium]HNU70397.1 hypothetical protein [Thermodesulfobacteriota bacterium]